MSTRSLIKSTYSMLWSLAVCSFFIGLTSFSLSARAIDSELEQAEAALQNQQYELAKELFTNLSQQELTKVKAQFGLARLAFFQDQLDLAEDHIEQVLELDLTNPEHFYYAARIAGKQAQSASIFTKLGYAKDTKKYFTQALKLDRHHKLSIVGLIGFHQQAPVIAGGDKDAILPLIEALRKFDKRAAFSIQAPSLFTQNEVDKIFDLYREALTENSTSDTSVGEFKFNFAMLLANQGMYLEGLKELVSIEFDESHQLPNFANMRLYQIGKLAAESKSELELGITSIKQYTALAEENKTIPNGWVNFRLAQLNYLKLKGVNEQEILEKIMRNTDDKNLKDKIESVLNAD